MKNRNIIILIAVAFVFWIMSKKRAFESLDLRPGFPSNFKLNGGTYVFDLPLNAFNGSSGTLNIGGADLRVFVENQYVGRAIAPGNQQILPAGQTTLYSQVFLTIADLATALPGVWNGLQDRALELRLKGTINVEGIYVNVDIPVNFNLPKFA